MQPQVCRIWTRQEPDEWQERMEQDEQARRSRQQQEFTAQEADDVVGFRQQADAVHEEMVIKWKQRQALRDRLEQDAQRAKTLVMKQIEPEARRRACAKGLASLGLDPDILMLSNKFRILPDVVNKVQMQMEQQYGLAGGPVKGVSEGNVVSVNQQQQQQQQGWRPAIDRSSNQFRPTPPAPGVKQQAQPPRILGGIQNSHNGVYFERQWANQQQQLPPQTSVQAALQDVGGPHLRSQYSGPQLQPPPPPQQQHQQYQHTTYQPTSQQQQVQQQQQQQVRQPTQQQAVQAQYVRTAPASSQRLQQSATVQAAALQASIKPSSTLSAPAAKQPNRQLKHLEWQERARVLLVQAEAMIPGSTDEQKKQWCCDMLCAGVEAADHMMPEVGQVADTAAVNAVERTIVTEVVDKAWVMLQQAAGAGEVPGVRQLGAEGA
eukprot:jgi/Chrzof1/10005/Cz04g23210.t1